MRKPRRPHEQRTRNRRAALLRAWRALRYDDVVEMLDIREELYRLG